MSFRVFQDNGGGYRWTIVAGSGETLARSRSGGFASHEDAKHAALIVHAGAAAASFEHFASDTPPVDLVARRQVATLRDDLDAERWLDERGGFTSEAATRWPAAR
jgi:uncharacterized protein YegP (UPF0339 family)